MLNLIPVEWRVGLAAGALLLAVFGAGGAYLKGHSDGKHQANLEWQVRWDKRESDIAQMIADTKAMQDKANDDAKAAEELELEQLRQQIEDQATMMRQLVLEADQDPNADNVALDADAVARHNRSIQ